MNTTAIAQHLHIATEAIIKIEEWASVLWVRFKGGCKFVSKKIMKNQPVTAIKDDAYGASVVVNNTKYHYSELNKTVNSHLGLSVVWETFLAFQNHSHCQIALDAGGEIVEAETNKWGETILKKVSVESDKLIAYCQKLKAAQNPHEGMMQTSTGEWVFADDWDVIEGAR